MYSFCLVVNKKIHHSNEILEHQYYRFKLYQFYGDKSKFFRNHR